jgi:hypothetical protein
MGPWDKNDFGEIKAFMNAIGNLYMDYFQHHIDEAKACLAEVQACGGSRYQENYGKDLEHINLYYIWEIVRRLENTDWAWDDPWELACRLRTNVEAFDMMFSEVSKQKLRTDEIVEFVGARRGGPCICLPSEIPKNAPASHWWWFN